MAKLLTILIIFTLTGCTQAPAQVQDYSEFIFSKAQSYQKNSARIIPKKPQKPKATSNKYDRLLTVKRGDGLYALTEKYGVSAREVIRMNNLKAPYLLNKGQKLKLPKTSSKANNPERYKSPKIAKKPSISKKKWSGKAPSKFKWPVKGKIIAKFGSKNGALSNEGINILAKRGANVRAAAAGEIVYTGNGLKGYGKLLIIRHGGGWLTAYAHNKSFKVKKGDIIKTGQIIGHVGSTGNVSRPQLHFAIRKGKKAVDPMKYL